MSKPVAVLTRLEDSPPALDRRLVAAYLQTVYRVVDLPFIVYIGKTSPAPENWLLERGLDCFAFLTAANPRSYILPEAENEQRNAALLTALTRLTPLPPYPAVHEAISGDWPPEKSWWAPGLAAVDAVELGRRFDQHALVFWQRGGVAELWWL